MIVLIGAEKGGTGKTVLTVNLASMRALLNPDKKVIIVDTDKQGTALRWVTQRDKNPKIAQKIDCLPLAGDDIGKKILSLKDRYDDIFIDTRGSDAVELRASLVIADWFITPVRTSQFDAWTIEYVDAIYHRAGAYNKKLQGGLVINLAKTNSNSTKVAIEEMKKLKHLPFTGVVIIDRDIYGLCQPMGESIFEYKTPIKKAEEEMLAIYEVIYQDDREETARSIAKTIAGNS